MAETRTIWRRTAAAAVLGAALAVGGCEGTRRVITGEKIAPDEFRVVTKAPLVIPPEFNVRPPRPGEMRPEELIPADAARQALLSDRAGVSDAEQLLLAKAGVAFAEPGIRALVDAEFAGLITKNETFANRILFYANGDTIDGVTLETASAEELERRQRLQESATGGDPVLIQRRSGVKLPGL